MSPVEGLAGISVGPIVLCLLIIAVGSAIQASFGLGLALFSAPLLALVDTRLVPGPMMVATLAVSAGMAYRERSAIQGRELGVSLIGLLAGTALGAAALKLVAGEHLPQILGALILVAVLISASGFAVRANPPALLAGGTAAGIMGTMIGIHGPPIALVFQNSEPIRARAMLGSFFAVGNAVGIVALAIVGLFGREQAVLGAVLVPGAVLGWVVAPACARFVSRKWLKVAILTISGLSAVVLLFR
jgi:uncharacterized membrane protein YfcA